MFQLNKPVCEKECYFSINTIWGSIGHTSLHANRVWIKCFGIQRTQTRSIVDFTNA